MKHLTAFFLLLSIALAPALAEDAKTQNDVVAQNDVESVLNEKLKDLPKEATQAAKALAEASLGFSLQTPILISANDVLWLVLGHDAKAKTVSVYHKKSNEEFRRVGQPFAGPVVAASVFPTADGKFEDSLHLFFSGAINNHNLLTPAGKLISLRNYPGELRAVYQQFLLSDQSYEFVKGQWTPGVYAFSKTPTVQLGESNYIIHSEAADKGVCLVLSSGPSRIKIHRDDKPIVFPTLPLTAAYGNELAIVYLDDAKWTLLLANPISGAVLSEKPIQTTTLGDSMDAAKKIYGDFFFVIMICLFVIMFGLKPRPITRMGVSPGPFRVAAVWKRLVALLIDYIPCSMITWIIFVPQEKSKLIKAQIQAGAEAKELAATMEPEGIYALIASLALLLVISTACEWKWGQTLGKRIMGIRVAADGSLKLNAREVLLRNLMKILEFLALMTSGWWMQILLIAPPIFTPLHQRLGDMAARTVVIDLRVPPKPAAIAPAGEQG